MEQRLGPMKLSILVVSISVMVTNLFFTPSDARFPAELLRQEPKQVPNHAHVVDSLSEPRNVEGYDGLSALSSLSPLESLAPLPFPVSPPYCVNPPSPPTPSLPNYTMSPLPPPSPHPPSIKIPPPGPYHNFASPPANAPAPKPPKHEANPPPGPPHNFAITPASAPAPRLPKQAARPPHHEPSPPKVHPPPVGLRPPWVPPPPQRKPKFTVWCVAKPTVPDSMLQEALDYACGSGADCKAIQPKGPCFQPNSLISHASYAFNSYWQKTKLGGGTCDFGGTAMLVTVDPSFSGCHFIIN